MNERWAITVATLIHHLCALFNDDVPFLEPWKWKDKTLLQLLKLANLDGDEEVSKYLADIQKLVQKHRKILCFLVFTFSSPPSVISFLGPHRRLFSPCPGNSVDTR
jgi:hypothetical protein